MKRTLINRAITDLEIVDIINLEDEYRIDVSAYHLHQAIEKLVKVLLEDDGIEYSKMHNLITLIDKTDIKHHIKLESVRVLDIRDWESNIRYAGDFSASVRQIQEVDVIAKDLLEYVKGYHTKSINCQTKEF